MFKTENRLLFEMLTNARDKKKMLSVLKQHNHSGKVDEVSAKAILGILNVKMDLAKILKKDETGREVYDMCQAFEDYKEDGRQLGLKQGRREGKKEGKKEGKREGELMMALKLVKNLMRKEKMSFDEAAKYLDISKKLKNELMTLI